MGVMKTLKVMRLLLKEWNLPEDFTVSWDMGDSREVAYAEERFREYLADGWMAFTDEPTGRKQIFRFNPGLKRIILIPPLGGG